MKTICLIGPECTGKTTLAAVLAHEHETAVSREYSRQYAETVGRALTADDVDPIAAGQIDNLERAAAEAANGIVFADTDLLSTVVYARHYYGSCPAWIEEEATRRRADLYLLLDTDLEWEPDGVRDSPGEAREDLFDAFRRVLDEFGAEWRVVSGVGDERVERARTEVRVMKNHRDSQSR